MKYVIVVLFATYLKCMAIKLSETLIGGICHSQNCHKLHFVVAIYIYVTRINNIRKVEICGTRNEDFRDVLEIRLYGFYVTLQGTDGLC
jgi:hypothetical protein